MLLDTSIIFHFFSDLVGIFNEMSPYLLLGFLFAGLLKVFLPQNFIDRYMSKSNLRSVLLSSLLGIPLPLCSCGVIPTGVSIHKNGASKGATISFLISTPQTGIDSILITYSLLGLPFTIIRPIVALFTGVFGGILGNTIISNKTINSTTSIKNSTSCSTDGEVCCSDSSCCSSDSSCSCHDDNPKRSKLYRVFKYAFVDFLQDIAKWLVIGMILAALISVLVPDDFFVRFIGNQWIEMLIILLVAIPLYVCATGSVPIVAVLMLKGLSPGAALVFLMAGPATNMATLTVLRKSIGKQATWVYLAAIVVGAIVFGSVINYLLPQTWFQIDAISKHHAHQMLPSWLEWGSTILLAILIANGFYQKKRSHKLEKNSPMNQKLITVNGMNCNHCKNSVEKNLSVLEGIQSVEVNLEQKTALITGDKIDLSQLELELKKLGFEYGGEK